MEVEIGNLEVRSDSPHSVPGGGHYQLSKILIMQGFIEYLGHFWSLASEIIKISFLLQKLQPFKVKGLAHFHRKFDILFSKNYLKIS